ncbi:MAG TPA: S9 family peptidase [Microscillaceae bacterium]|nr:S9 family peptidase [Microscillaceae bacterium]
MRKSILCLVALCLALPTLVTAQQKKQPIPHSVYDGWKNIRNQTISRDGQWVIYSLTPQEGDARLMMHQPKKNRKKGFERGVRAKISYDDRFVVFKIKPQLDKVKNLRRRKTKKNRLPKDSLGIYDLSKDQLVKVPRVRSFKMPKKAGKWLAYQLEAPKPKKRKKGVKKKGKASPDKTGAKKKVNKKRKKKAKKKRENKKNGAKLVLRNLQTGKQDTFAFVTSYHFSENGDLLTFISTGSSKDKKFPSGVYVYDLKKNQLMPAFQFNKAKFAGLSIDRKGTQVAFMVDTDTTKANKKAQIKYYKLYQWSKVTNKAQIVADQSNPAMPSQWIVNRYGKLLFSKNGKKLYFGTSPKPLVRDTSLLPEEIVKVDVWNWQDGQLQPQQKVRLKADKRRSYQAVIHLDNNNKMVQLATPEIPNFRSAQKGNANVGMLMTNKPYEKYMSWIGFPAYSDVYQVDLKTGNKKKVYTRRRNSPINLSPTGQYITWYSVLDSAWFNYAIKTGKTYNLTKGLPVVFYNETHDSPTEPRPYGMAGWTANDQKLLIYDRFDIWEFDPENRQKPRKITQNGRAQKLRYRYVKTNREEEFINVKKPLLLHTFNEVTRGEGFYALKMNQAPKKLVSSAHSYSARNVRKAAKGDQVIFTKENFQKFPDIHMSDLSFKSDKKLSNANPQQKNYSWGTVEIVSWTSTNGQKLQGLLYKPEGFDAKKKYPMITYFYERVTDRIHRHWVPQPSWSIIIPSVYASNGYVVFMPDIPYFDGYPGHSAEHAILSGVANMVDKGFIDRDRLAIQGQSWGGYQVAHLITRSNMFRAAMAGAPVANMTSAYGGIRWGSGLSRMFQYERSQSRIGGTLWEKPLQYIENSPLFSADRVQTPLLMMHNDKDGAVPWYQGIEYFVALRRLQKPVWMLTYNGEAHNLRKRQNRKDLTIRMMQFFDHYLKGKPAPVWMTRGIPAVEKGINKGYKLSNENSVEQKNRTQLRNKK